MNGWGWEISGGARGSEYVPGVFLGGFTTGRGHQNVRNRDGGGPRWSRHNNRDSTKLLVGDNPVDEDPIVRIHQDPHGPKLVQGLFSVFHNARVDSAVPRCALGTLVARKYCWGDEGCKDGGGAVDGVETNPRQDPNPLRPITYTGLGSEHQGPGRGICDQRTHCRRRSGFPE